MKLFRVVDDFAFTTNHALLAKTKRSAGRWNAEHIPALYSALCFENCLCEVGYYKIISPSFNGKSPISILNDIYRRDFFLIEFRCNVEKLRPLHSRDHFSSLSICHTNEPELEARRSQYFMLPNKWTQGVGSALSNSGVKGIEVLSARADNCHNVILFVQNICAGDIDVENVTSFRFLPLDHKNVIHEIIKKNFVKHPSKVACSIHDKVIIVDIAKFN